MLIKLTKPGHDNVMSCMMRVGQHVHKGG